ncbi:hypothetical protein FQA39_LY14179 [Lamprigera yunnana]|nr:hypothetical protein FQA39_LY14179 [Lamprigera yunnana]
MEIIVELPKDIDKLCRTCMGFADGKSPLFDFIATVDEKTELCKMLLSVTSLKVSIGDGLPTHLCNYCVEQLNTAYTFIQQCTESDYTFKNVVNSFAKEEHTMKEEEAENAEICLGKINKDLICKVCNETFKSYYQLSMHTVTHNASVSLTERFKSSSCDDDQFDLKDFRDPVEVYSLIEECRQSLVSLNENVNKLNQCGKCCREFKSEFALAKHISKQSCRNKTVRTACTFCGKHFSDLLNLSLHFLNHSLAYEVLNSDIVPEVFFCEVCGQVFEDNSCLADHYNDKHNYVSMWECTDCMEVFDKEKNLLSHVALTHGFDTSYTIEAENSVQCNLCPEEFSSKIELHKHSLSHLMRRYTCKKCSLCFSTQYAYYGHLKDHNPTHCICKICGKYLSTNSALKSHIEGVHSETLEYCCAICGKRFSTVPRLKTHSKIHTTEKKHICSFCGYSSHKSGDLIIHTRTHTSERPYKCTFSNCTMSFKTSSHLCHHIRRHLKIKKYKCDICLGKFSTNNGLKVHQMQHTGEKPYLCMVCKRTFRRKYHLKVHMNQHTS